MTKVTKCMNGHYYDADKFSTCPYCKTVSSKSNGYEEMSGADSQSKNTEPVTPVNDYTVPVTEKKTVSDQKNARSQISSLVDAVADSQKTIGKFTTGNNGKSPVVGWLVCVEGKHYGEDFRLRAGNNFIGRDSTMDVVLTMDTSVSRNKHAIVIFDPVSCTFIVKAGESHELSYLNGQILLDSKIMKPYDKISIGSSTLLLIPLCGENFNWEKKES